MKLQCGMWQGGWVQAPLNLSFQFTPTTLSAISICTHDNKVSPELWFFFYKEPSRLPHAVKQSGIKCGPAAARCVIAYPFQMQGREGRDPGKMFGTHKSRDMHKHRQRKWRVTERDKRARRPWDHDTFAFRIALILHGVDSTRWWKHFSIFTR